MKTWLTAIVATACLWGFFAFYHPNIHFGCLVLVLLAQALIRWVAIWAEGEGVSMRKFSKMPLRKLGDGKISIRDNGDEFWQITCGGQVLSVSEHLTAIVGPLRVLPPQHSLRVFGACAAGTSPHSVGGDLGGDAEAEQ